MLSFVLFSTQIPTVFLSEGTFSEGRTIIVGLFSGAITLSKGRFMLLFFGIDCSENFEKQKKSFEIKHIENIHKNSRFKASNLQYNLK